MARRRTFTLPELELLGEAGRVARDLTGQFFALPDDWFERASHEVCSARCLRPGERLGAGRLAQIRCVYRERSAAAVLRCRRWGPHYRICVQDHNVLDRAAREPAVPLPELLTCVLTHEYVHLVRFCRAGHPYLTTFERQVEEERRVEAVTGAILSSLGYRRLRDAAARLSP